MNVLEHGRYSDKGSRDGPSEDVVHLPNDYNATTFHTMCGLCDVPNTIDESNAPADCAPCMAVLAHVLNLAAERGVLRSKPRASTLERARKPSEEGSR